MVKAVIFDLDGVLIDSADLHYNALNQALVECGFESIGYEDHLKRFNGLPTKVKLGMLAIPPAEQDKVSQIKQELTIQTIKKHCVSPPEIRKVLWRLKAKGIKLGVVTNSIWDSTYEMLQIVTGSDMLFDVVITNQDVKDPKPDPSGYLLAIRKLFPDPKYNEIDRLSETLIVEDSPKGIEAAEKALMGFPQNVIAVSNPYSVNWELFEGRI